MAKPPFAIRTLVRFPELRGRARVGVRSGQTSALNRPPRDPHCAFLLVAGMLVVLWEIWAASFNTALFGDNVEQSIWAQSLELGYHKHPPLPSWILGAVLRVVGPSIYWTYALAAMCLIGTMAFVWLLARELIGTRGATAALLLYGLSMNFAQRAQLYNHNTVLTLFTAMTAWCGWRASAAGRRGSTAWWLLTGLSAAGAVLSKYQAVVPLTGVVLALGFSGRLRTRVSWRGLGIALGTLIALCVPHFIWMVEHDYSTLRYASEAAAAESTFLQRLGFILSFLANQIRLWSSVLLAMLLLYIGDRYVTDVSEAGAVTSVASPSIDAADAWFAGLLWFGLAVLAVMALCVGVGLRNHWGVQALQYFAPWMVWRWKRGGPIDLKRLTWTVVVIHALNMVWYAVEHRSNRAVISERRNDTAYPAQRLANAAVEHWRAHVHCPLHYVAGTAFDAGLVSLYSGGHVRVFDSDTATPWIAPNQLSASGAVYVLDDAEDVPAGIVDLIDFPLVEAGGSDRRHKSIRIGLRYPTEPCDDPKSAPTGTQPRRSS